jgi:hypothetical protein
LLTHIRKQWWNVQMRLSNYLYHMITWNKLHYFVQPRDSLMDLWTFFL